MSVLACSLEEINSRRTSTYAKLASCLEANNEVWCEDITLGDQLQWQDGLFGKALFHDNEHGCEEDKGADKRPQILPGKPFGALVEAEQAGQHCAYQCKGPEKVDS